MQEADTAYRMGAQYGLWVGILIGFGERWFDYAFDATPIIGDAIINGILNIVFFIVLGILVSLVYGKLSSSAYKLISNNKLKKAS